MFSQTGSVFLDKTAGLPCTYLFVKTGYRVAQKCIFLGHFGVCAYSILFGSVPSELLGFLDLGRALRWA